MKKLSVILILLITNPSLHAQKQLLFQANELFEMGNLLSAMIKYRMFLTAEPNNQNALKQIGLCYLTSNIDKSKAIPYFEKCLESKKHDKEIMFYLADAYVHNMEYDKAKEALDKYSKKSGKFKKEIPVLRNQINVSLDLIAKPVNVTITNLGKTVNTQYADYFPFIDKKEKLLVFSSRKLGSKGMIGYNGYYPSDIYTSRFNGFKFSRSKSAKSLNTNYDEESIGITDDGSYIFVAINNFNASERGNIFKSQKKGSTYKRKEPIPGKMNSVKSYESSGTISDEGNTIYFSSNRSGGKGGFDLYLIKKLPNGEWGAPQNIEEVNTYRDEEYPYYNTSDSILYFSSNGLPGMGSYDLFKTKWNPMSETWSNPVNLGYPINSAYDERTICFSDDNVHAYISSVRKGGFGDFDIYRLKFEDYEVKPALYLIKVTDIATSELINTVEIKIINEHNDVIGKYKPNEKTKVFTIIIHPGEYKIRLKANKYNTLFQKFKVSEFAADKVKTELNYKMTKK